jgi:putative membrane protein
MPLLDRCAPSGGLRMTGPVRPLPAARRSWKHDAMSFLLRVLINAAAIWLATVLLDGLDVVGGDDTTTRVLVFLGVALVFGLVNAVVRPIVAFLSFPLYILTLGLFTLVVNALMIMLTGWLSEMTEYGLRVDGFWTALLAGLIIAVVSFLLSVVVPGTGNRRD